jgi:hypothetical protein
MSMGTKMDIDKVSLELSQEIALESIEKALPPKLLYRFRRWMRQMRQTSPIAEMPVGKFEQIVFEKFKEIQSSSGVLAKNEASASFYDGGIIKMDFGSEIKSSVKEAALRWAKKKGLKVVEMSLNKSSNSVTAYTFASSDNAIEGKCIKKIKWSL